MPKHKIRITQVTRVERSITIDVEADTIEDAVELQQGSDSPATGDPRWTVDREDLENEEVAPA